MGNKMANSGSDITNCKFVNIMMLFVELRADLIDNFEDIDKGTLRNIDTIAFYGDFREILIVDGLNKKKKLIY